MPVCVICCCQPASRPGLSSLAASRAKADVIHKLNTFHRVRRQRRRRRQLIVTGGGCNLKGHHDDSTRLGGLLLAVVALRCVALRCQSSQSQVGAHRCNIRQLHLERPPKREGPAAVVASGQFDGANFDGRRDGHAARAAEILIDTEAQARIDLFVFAT